jgi:hypothetical protein
MQQLPNLDFKSASAFLNSVQDITLNTGTVYFQQAVEKLARIVVIAFGVGAASMSCATSS